LKARAAPHGCGLDCGGSSIAEVPAACMPPCAVSIPPPPGASRRPIRHASSGLRDALQGFRWLKLGISFPREILYQRIERRVEEMFEGGFVEEVRSLLSRFSRDCQAFKAIGYRQIAEYLEGKCSLECAIENTKLESRRYAKRQLTWFRSKGDIVWLEAPGNVEDLEPRAAHHIAEFLES
jgi:tRNA A37 N6-isopentenylltransferase MiaA